MVRLWKDRQGQFVIIAVLMIAIMVISVVSFIYATATYYRQESWEDYLNVVNHIELGSRRILEMGLGNFTQRFLEGTIRDKETWENLIFKRILSSWRGDLRAAYATTGLELSLDGEGGRLLASRWYIPEGDTYLIKCYWYSQEVISSIYLNLKLNLSTQGLHGYQTSMLLYLHVLLNTSYIDASPDYITNLNLTVTKEEEEPIYGLKPESFLVKKFDHALNDWVQVTISNVTYQGDGNYRLNFEAPITKPYYKWLFITVEDQRGFVVVCSTYSFIEFVVERATPDMGRSGTDDEVYTLESGINGTWYWNGKRLEVVTGNESSVLPPIPTIPIRLFRVNVTEDGVNGEWTISPCQYEIWDRVNWHNQTIDVPRDLADPDSPFNSSNRIVFQVKFPSFIDRQRVMLWWESDLDASPYQGPSDLEYIPGSYVARTNRYEVEFIGVGHTQSDDYPYDYHGVAALLMKDPSTGLCFGPWNLHSFGVHRWSRYKMLGEWRPYGPWQIKYWYGGEAEARAVVRLIAILNSTEVECVYNYDYPSHGNGPFDNYYDTYAVAFITANVKYLQLSVRVYWKEAHRDEGLWFAAVMGKGEPEYFAYLRYEDGAYASDYDYASPTYEEDEDHGSGPPMIPGHWGAHWSESFGRGLMINEEGLQCLRSFDASRTRFSITEAAPGGARQGSIEFQALNFPDGPDTIDAGTSYSYILAMWMYDGGTGLNGYSEVQNYHWMFLEGYSPKITISEG